MCACVCLCARVQLGTCVVRDSDFTCVCVPVDVCGCVYIMSVRGVHESTCVCVGMYVEQSQCVRTCVCVYVHAFVLIIVEVVL